ncbi:MAG: hypothetical protein BWZ04_02740 [Firmicutes bacterium ADurb.BinA205]|nr:MAG: hypothetical protein BWZ04_02740 [Firmicutes bacterium ADurb.BinA205]
MATSSIADKLAKLETKIAKREKTIADETKELDKDRAEYNKLYIMLLSDKYKLSGKDLFSAIESDLDELEKLRDGVVSEKDPVSSSSEKVGVVKGASADTARHSFPHTFTEVNEAEQKKGDNN